MVKTSAGLLMYNFDKDGELLIFLGHPGGPYYERKDNGNWGIPKGEQDDLSHDFFDVAKREFFEETGIVPLENKDEYISLGKIKQKNGKIVHAWAFLNNNSFIFKCESMVEMFYDDKKIIFPELDKGEFFNLKLAKNKILDSQKDFLIRLEEILNKDKIKIKQAKLF
jgi:predicted NUDIX family NTP pyrophosphohydrolase